MTAETTVRSDPAWALMPWLDEGERAVRNRLLRAQQYSARRAQLTASKTARTLLWLINETAAAYVSSAASLDLLQDVADTLARLALAANGFERLES